MGVGGCRPGSTIGEDEESQYHAAGAAAFTDE